MAFGSHLSVIRGNLGPNATILQKVKILFKHPLKQQVLVTRGLIIELTIMSIYLYFSSSSHVSQLFFVS
jgi:hypothetical protein